MSSSAVSGQGVTPLAKLSQMGLSTLTHVTFAAYVMFDDPPEKVGKLEKVGRLA